MALPLPPAHRHRLSLPVEPGLRAGTWSLLMVAATAVAVVAAGVVGTVLQVVVFDLEEQESLGHARTAVVDGNVYMLAIQAPIPSVAP